MHHSSSLLRILVFIGVDLANPPFVRPLRLSGADCSFIIMPSFVLLSSTEFIWLISKLFVSLVAVDFAILLLFRLNPLTLFTS